MLNYDEYNDDEYNDDEYNDDEYNDDEYNDSFGECGGCGAENSPWNEMMDDYCCDDCWETQTSNL